MEVTISINYYYALLHLGFYYLIDNPMRIIDILLITVNLSIGSHTTCYPFNHCVEFVMDLSDLCINLHKKLAQYSILII